MTNLRHPPTVRVRIGAPVEGLTYQDPHADTEQIMDAIVGLLPAEAREVHEPTAEELALTFPPVTRGMIPPTGHTGMRRTDRDEDVHPRSPRQTLFDNWSRVYDWPPVQRAAYRPVHDAIIRALPPTPGQRILDVGCGTGLLATRVAAQPSTGHVVGCDYSDGMLQQAAQRTQAPGTVDWVRGDAMRLPFDGESFDVLLCSESFHWYEDQRAALCEFVRVVAQDGRVLVTLDRPRLAPSAPTASHRDAGGSTG